MAGSLLRMTIPPPIIAISNFILKVSTKVHTIRELRHGNEKFYEKTKSQGYYTKIYLASEWHQKKYLH